MHIPCIQDAYISGLDNVAKNVYLSIFANEKDMIWIEQLLLQSMYKWSKLQSGPSGDQVLLF